MTTKPGSTRRAALAAGAGLVALLARPRAFAADDPLRAAVLAFTGGTAPAEGRVHLELPPLVENGNTVPLVVSAEGAVRTIAVFNERNPQRDVAVFRFGPRSGGARVETRIRLATSQRLVAVAQDGDGMWWQAGVDVIVTLAACIE